MGKRIRHHVNPLGILKEHTFGGFGNARDIIVDIGAFKGEFIAGLLEKFPQYNYVVSEVRSPIAQRLRERFKKYDNVAVFDGDGTRNLRNILEPCQKQGAFVREIYINFPDPWPKKRHKKRRIITEKFLRSTQSWIDPRTTWIFQTDRKDVFEDTIEILESLQYAYEKFDAPPYGVTTDWEDAKVAIGQTIYRMRFWVGVPAQSPQEKDTFIDNLIGATALAALSVLHWLGTDDGH